MRSYIADQRRQAMCLFVKGRAGQRASKDPPQMNTASAPPALCTEWQVIESSMETRGIGLAEGHGKQGESIRS